MKSSLLARGAFAALFIAGFGSSAFALEPTFSKLSVQGDGIGVPRITVVSDGSGKWTSVKAEKLSYQAHVDVQMKKGEIVSVYVTGHPIAGMLDANNGYYAGEYVDGPKSFNKVVAFKMSSSQLAIPAVVAVSKCNALLDQGKSPYQDQSLFMSVPLGLSVSVHRGNTYRTKIADGEATAVVVCKAMNPPPATGGSKKAVSPNADAGDLKLAPIPPVVKKVQLAIKTNGSKACPQNATLTTWLFTDKPGKVSFIYRKAGDGKSNPITVNAVPGSNGVFLATHTQTVQISQTTDTKYMSEALGSGKISNWVPLKVTCLANGGALNAN